MKTTIELAREAAGDDWKLFQDFMPEIHRLADLVRADAIDDEREACAKVAETYRDWDDTGMGVAAAIRARGETSLRSNT